MKFALVNGQKAEAQKGLRGTCANCQSDTLAKCGRIKIWHWAHTSKVSCDPWWENETEWHRAWKNQFPKEWQEIGHIDSATGEKHIADIKTNNEFIIEFQNSPIKHDEIQSREAFYKNMVWVVNGTRLKRDYKRFRDGFSSLRRLRTAGFFLTSFPEECFHPSWLNRSVPVYFDFMFRDANHPQDYLSSVLWCLFPGPVEGNMVVAGVPREDFIKFASNDHHLLFAREILYKITKAVQLDRAYIKRRQAINLASYLNNTRNPRSRRYRHL